MHDSAIAIYTAGSHNLQIRSNPACNFTYKISLQLATLSTLAGSADKYLHTLMRILNRTGIRGLIIPLSNSVDLLPAIAIATSR